MSGVMSLFKRKDKKEKKDMKAITQGDSKAVLPSAPPDISSMDYGRFGLLGRQTLYEEEEEEERCITILDLEVDLHVEILANKETRVLIELIAQLCNLQVDYVGKEHTKAIWIGLAVVAAFNSRRVSKTKQNQVYKGEVSNGIRLLIDSEKPFELDKRNKWCQQLNYLTNGVKTEWSIRGEIIRTMVPYLPQPGNEDIVTFLSGMGVRCYVNPDGHLVLKV
ncbi:matrix [Muir Springs virus]|uniref:Matrix n=1 Tax=Muir Springs virus TaxID=932700 RepID=A0A0D3R1K0_9RHAB|nr:matrix [Muir Springs virus]AJR28340.1 matrix [Muir Springs virus]